jgi:hypothetical protein
MMMWQHVKILFGLGGREESGRGEVLLGVQGPCGRTKMEETRTFGMSIASRRSQPPSIRRKRHE